jgi:exosome complex exonuclease RRP6
VEKEEEDLQGALSALLRALGEGVSSASRLPTNNSSSSGDGNSKADNNDNDFAFARSFPEFSRELSTSRNLLSQVLMDTLGHLEEASGDSLLVSEQQQRDEDLLGDGSFDDALLWERCEDACERLLDRLEQQQQQQQPESTTSELALQTVSQLGRAARYKSESSYGALQRNLVDMVKPQVLYGMKSPQTSRTQPFVPPFLLTKPNALVPLDLSLLPGHGLGDRFPIRTTTSAVAVASRSSALIAPDGHVAHPYKAEIEALEYPSWQLEIPEKLERKIMAADNTRLLSRTAFVDKPEDLELLASELQGLAAESNRRRLMVALDLEAHSLRTFAGFTCLVQISYRVMAPPTTSDSHGEGAGASPTAATQPSNSDNPGEEIRSYLIDALRLQPQLHLLLPTLTDPNVVKVMHGADSDIQWLQRDFGLYVVNLFDTGRAARYLGLPSFAYAHLLHRYAGITADKRYQLADWRQRPLPDELKLYAVQDTHYLIQIYDRIKADLGTHDRIKAVLDTSKLVCLSRYAVEPFDPEGYKTLLSYHRRNSSSSRGHHDLDPVQERVLKELWDWRDRVAREQDESLHFVCPKSALVRLALACRQLSNLRSLQSLFNPVPSPILLQRADEILDLIQKEVLQEEEKEEHPPAEDYDIEDEAGGAAAAATASSSLPLSPCRQNADKEMSAVMASSSSQQQHRPSSANAFALSAFLTPSKGDIGGSGLNGTSPVLGTEALYLQAGWMTPHEKLRALAGSATSTCSSSGSGTSAGEGGGGGGESGSRSQATAKTKNLVSLHASNKNYQASAVAGATAKVTKASDGGAAPLLGRSVDGMATVWAARGDEAAGPGAAGGASLEEEIKRAKQNSSVVQAKLRGSLPSVLGLVTPIIDLLDDDEAAAEDGRGESRVRDAIAATASIGRGDEDFDVPRSMREIYKISNRNRRNKKAGSPTPERGVTPTSEKEQEELARAEALLKERGLLPSAYFDEGGAGGGSPGKRARTKPSSGRESEETVPQDAAALASREEDFAILKSVGWIPEGATAGGFDFASAGPAVALDPTQLSANPFFSGAALTGGPLSQGFAKPDQRTKKPNPGRGKQVQGRRQERPEKKDGRTHAYRKR